VTAGDLPGYIRSPETASSIPGPSYELGGEGASLQEIEKGIILQALNKNGWNQSAAARSLGIPRHVLLYRMKKFGIDK
jgi:transcriptional regulator of acetoin/glycerol metabolism